MVATVDPDEDLVRRVGQGDPTATQTFVARKLPRVLAERARLRTIVTSLSLTTTPRRVPS